MAELAIKGHPTRRKEVIEILEMLGGENKYKLNGCNIECAYYIKNGVIHNTSPVVFNNIKLLTLEEFLEKFPYKVGDKVKNARINDFIGRFTNARWDNKEEQIIYTVEWDDVTKSTLTYFAIGLQPYKEETIDKANEAVFDCNAQCCDIMNDIIKKDMKEIKIDIPAGYEFAGVDDNAQQVVFQKIRPQYPKTYEECCKVLKTTRIHIEGLGLDEVNRIKPFIQLLRCRDAYWKLGEQMGLVDKPWKPTWNGSESYYCIFCDNCKIVEAEEAYSNTILAFPTKEMRDAFYENFKELIEVCKELL